MATEGVEANNAKTKLRLSVDKDDKQTLKRK